MAAESDVQCEIEVLQSIYLDDLTVTRSNDGGWRVSVVLHPSTGEDCLAQFVRLTLTLDLDSEYPASPPCISIHHPRGLSDDKLLSLEHSLHSEAEDCVGTSVLYQLIEKAKEILTESNIPHGSCVICLYGFKEGEVFTKTSCYHYFHSHCLGRYVTHSQEELQERVKELKQDKTRDGGECEELCVVCPVCREPLEYDLNTLLSSPQPSFSQEDSAVSAEFKRKWADLQKILDRQREKGGVIDPEAESNRFLIHINHAPADSSDSACADASDPDSAQILPPPPLPPACSNQNPRPPRAENAAYPSYRRALWGSHGRRQQGEFRGGRRDRGKGGGGRGGHAAHAVPPCVLENLTKLSVSVAESSRNSEAPQDASRNLDRHLVKVIEEAVPALEDERVETSLQDAPESKHEQQAVSNRARERGTGQERDRGRRHGPRGPPYSHWHERNSQWDNGGNVHHHHHRGARGQRAGHHRGNGKSWHQRTESEFKKEGVL
ncbi:E3 ubiquitin-protein ligase RNF25 isoform 2-T2 [Clarias gariepinus]